MNRKERKRERVRESNLRYHGDPHHPSNWCEMCGYYYCWHAEVKEFDIHNLYQHALKRHKFIPGG